jgi:hypothetical protein
MKDTYFKIIGQKAVNDKIILVAVVDENFLGENLPSIFEVQAFKMAPTIYTETYPQIKINSETIKDRTDDLKGSGIGGIITEEMWYCKTIERKDIYSIGI